MSFFPDGQTFLLFSIGSLQFSIRWYAVLILGGALLGYFFCRQEIRKSRYINADFFDSLFVYTLWAGILGARLWYCAFYNFRYYISDPVKIIRIWDGGLAIQGGILGGALFAYWYTKKNRYSYLKILDICLPQVMLAQAIGRWGNFVNQECHGGEVAESYFDGILFFLKKGMYIDGHYYEPLFFYESILCLLGWLIIHFVLKKYQNKRGDLAYAYLMWYGTIRFFIEQRRTDSLYLGNFKMAQLTSLAFLVIGIAGFLGFFDKHIHKPKPTLIFDFDGTLIDTRAGIVEAYRYLFQKYAREEDFTPEREQEVIGPALKELFPKYFPDQDFDTLYKDYHEKQAQIMPVTNHPLPHVPEVLKSLHEQGYHLGIVSTRNKESIHKLLQDFDLDGYFDGVCGVYDVEKLKPDPEGIFKLVENNKWYRECVMIGDSMADIGCGSNYGAYTVAFLGDPSRSKELFDAANTSITDMDQLMDVLAQDIWFTYDLK